MSVSCQPQHGITDLVKLEDELCDTTTGKAALQRHVCATFQQQAPFEGQFGVK